MFVGLYSLFLGVSKSNSKSKSNCDSLRQRFFLVRPGPHDHLPSLVRRMCTIWSIKERPERQVVDFYCSRIRRTSSPWPEASILLGLPLRVLHLLPPPRHRTAHHPDLNLTSRAATARHVGPSIDLAAKC